MLFVATCCCRALFRRRTLGRDRAVRGTGGGVQRQLLQLEWALLARQGYAPQLIPMHAGHPTMCALEAWRERWLRACG